MTKRVPQKMPPIHPGEILQEDFMKPARLTAHRPGNGPSCSLHPELPKLSTNGVQSLRTQPFDLDDTSRRQPILAQSPDRV